MGTNPMSDYDAGWHDAMTQSNPPVRASEFVLDKTENPHPKMLERALKLRARLRVTHSPSDAHTWNGYLMAMADATGETTADIEGWMDRNDG